MKSMTGFGRATADFQNYNLTVDISSVNKKGLELAVSLPRDWQAMERLIAQKIKSLVERGKINIAIRAEFKTEKSGFSIDEVALGTALETLKLACQKLNVSFVADTFLLLKLSEDISASKESQPAPDWEEAWVEVEKVFDEAFAKFNEMRQTEGDALFLDTKLRLQGILELLCEVEKSSVGTVQKYKEQLLQRLASSGLDLDLNDERVLKEIALFADKCDITEEITRLKSHINQFILALSESDSVGRKMDFICQEMGREINTIASKANNLELTKLAIELKNSLERIREQIQNIL